MNRMFQASALYFTRSITSRRTLFPVVFCLVASSAFAAPQSAQTIYHDSCSLCHAEENARDNRLGAPLIGDQAAWAPRLAKGRQAMYDAAINGVPGGDMPGRRDYEAAYSEEEMRAAVDYMIRVSAVAAKSKRVGKWVAAEVRE